MTWNKKYILLSIILLSFLNSTFPVLGQANSSRVDLIEKERDELEQDKEKLKIVIEEEEKKLEELGENKESLEEKVKTIHKSIEELNQSMDKQKSQLLEINNEIGDIQSEIKTKEKIIKQRIGQLESQARMVQKKTNPQEIVSMLLSSESLSDLIGKVSVISQLISTHQNNLIIQETDMDLLSELEIALEEEQINKVKEKEKLEEDSNQLAIERQKLEETIITIANQYQIKTEEKEDYLFEYTKLSEKTDALTEELIVEENRKNAQQQEELNKVELKTIKDTNQLNDGSVEIATSSAETTDDFSGSEGKLVEKTNEWIRPAQGRVTSPYGWRIHPVYGDRRFHYGIDIAGSGPIIAAKSGRIIKSEYHPSLGYFVEIDHKDGYKSIYSHMQPNLTVSVGQNVSQGQQLGIMGTTGTSTGVHLDFQILKNDTNVDPGPYIGL